MMDPTLRSSFLRYVAQTSPQPDGFEVVRGDGIHLYDHQDIPYIDCISGIAVSSFGHRHPVIQQAIRDQLDLHLHTMVYGEHIQKPQVLLAEKLSQLLPADLDSTFFTNSGAEAVEGAIKLARKYTGRYEIIACRNAYHGSTLGAESLRSDIQHTMAYKPVVPGIRHMDFNSIADLDQIDNQTAAVILEPIQGEAGVILPDPEYLISVQQRCRNAGALFVLDEIQTGMGRTGTFCAFQQMGIVPDMLLLAKAFGGGLPLGAFISGRTLMQSFTDDPILGHMTTFGGHPLSCAASLAALRILEEEQLAAKAARHRDTIKQKLRDHPMIKEVRGRGLMLALELGDPSQRTIILQRCREQGLLLDWFLFNDRSIRLYPPLIITSEEIDLMLEKLMTALTD